MGTATAVSKTHSGLRPVSIRHDLAEIADLIEVCFADNMDSAGRAAVGEMRTLSRFGSLLWIVQGIDSILKGLMQGFVWVEDDRVVGNVSIYPAGYAHTWVIANVAVYPEYRGRGIAYELCEAALKRVVEWKGKTAILQVDEDNATALRLYERLGFSVDRIFTRWYWTSANPTPNPLAKMPDITYRNLHDWRAEYDLIQAVRPNERGGIGWLKPVSISGIRPSVRRALLSLFSPVSQEHWIIRGEGGRLDGLVLSSVGFIGSALRFDLFVHPDKQGALENPLVNYTLRRASDQYRSAVTEHPADDEAAISVFRRYNFQPKRTLMHMRWTH